MSDIIPEGILYGNLGVGSGTTNYNDLDNKPQINSVTLQGNKTASELGLVGTSDIPVTSVNGETGAVVLDGTEIEFATGVSLNEKIIAVEQEIPVIAYPVTSVNGETGAVVLDGTEINYQAGVTINQKIDAVEAEIPVISYPVTSVNGETGAVVLDGTDIEYSSGVSVNSQIDTLMQYIPVYNNTASGAIATFDTSLALPLQDCTIEINAVQESGTPTPSSPKLISGFTGANIHVADNETPHVIDNVTAITWQSEAGTVYGGSLDVTSGVLTVTHGFKTYTGASDENWRFEWAVGATQRNFYIGISDAKKTQTGQTSTLKCNISPINLTTSVTQDTCYISNGKNFNFTWGNTLNISSVTDFKTWLGSNSLEVCYELETPITYQLTPTQISAIVGTNNVFADTNGNTSVVFACSLKDYIEGQ